MICFLAVRDACGSAQAVSCGPLIFNGNAAHPTTSNCPFQPGGELPISLETYPQCQTRQGPAPVQIFDPLNLFFLAIVAIVIWRFAGVLGQREPGPRRSDPIASESIPSPTGRSAADREAAPPADPVSLAEAEKLRKAMPSFDVQSFLQGAELAYEEILSAFAAGELGRVKRLLDDNVYRSFADAIAQRKANGERMLFQLVKVNECKLLRSAIVNNQANVTVNFVSEMIFETTAAAASDTPPSPRRVADTWQFERDLKSRDPNWKLVATEDDIG
ncbi:MAG: Tim44/TimA family putative adaptor protein [Hyphomicrobiales bacterium]